MLRCSLLQFYGIIFPSPFNLGFYLGPNVCQDLHQKGLMKWRGFKLIHNSLMFLKFQLILGTSQWFEEYLPIFEVILYLINFMFSVIKTNIKILPLALLFFHLSNIRTCDNRTEAVWKLGLKLVFFPVIIHVDPGLWPDALVGRETHTECWKLWFLLFLWRGKS